MLIISSQLLSVFISNIFSRETWPDDIVTSDFGIFKSFENILIISLFAAPSTGGAVIFIFGSPS